MGFGMRLVLSLGSVVCAVTAGCTRPAFNNAYDPVFLACGSHERTLKREGTTALFQIAAPDGSLLGDEEVKELEVEQWQGESRQRIPVSPKGCVALRPASDSVLIARVPSRSWSLFHAAPRELPHGFPRTLSLGADGRPQVMLDCPAGGEFSSGVIHPGFSLSGVTDFERWAISLEVVPKKQGMGVYQVLRKNFGEALPPLSDLRLEGLTDGEYFVRASARDLHGNQVVAGNPSLCSIHLDRVAPRVQESGALSSAPSNVRALGSHLLLEGVDSGAESAETLVCMERSGEPQGTCSKPENFRNSSIAVFSEPGFWKVHAYSRDRAGNSSEVWTREFVIDANAPSVNLRWSDEKLNRLGGVSAGRSRAFSAVVDISDDYTDSSKMSESLRCVVQLKSSFDGNLHTGDYAECKNGSCKGKSLRNFVPCGAKEVNGALRVDLELNGPWSQFEGNLVVLTVQATDEIGRQSSAVRAFWIQDSLNWELVDLNIPGERDSLMASFGLGERDFILTSQGLLALGTRPEDGVERIVEVPAPEGFASFSDFASTGGEEERKARVLLLSSSRALLFIADYFVVFDVDAGFGSWRRVPEVPGSHDEVGRLHVRDAVQGADGRVWVAMANMAGGPEAEVCDLGAESHRYAASMIFELKPVPGALDWSISLAAPAPGFCRLLSGGKELMAIGEKSFFRYSQGTWVPIENAFDWDPVFPRTGVLLGDGSLWVADAEGPYVYRDGSWTHEDFRKLFSLLGIRSADETNMRFLLGSGKTVFMGLNVERSGVRSSYVLSFNSGWSCPSCQHFLGRLDFGQVDLDPSIVRSDTKDDVLFLAQGNEILRCSYEGCDVIKGAIPELGGFSGLLAEGPLVESPEGFRRVQRWSQHASVLVPELRFEIPEKIDGRTSDGRQWAVVRGMAADLEENSSEPSIVFKDGESWFPVGTPVSRNCTRGTFDPWEHLSVSANDDVFVVWCGGVQKLTPLGWERVDSVAEGESVTADFEEPDGARRITAFHQEEPGHFWVGRLGGEVEEHKNGRVQVVAKLEEPVTHLLQGKGGSIWVFGHWAVVGHIRSGAFEQIEAERLDEERSGPLVHFWTTGTAEIFAMEPTGGHPFLLDEERMLWKRVD